MRRTFALVATATAVLVLLAGCGSSSTSSTSSAASAPSTAAQSTPAPTTTAVSTGSGVVVLTKHGKLGTILAAGPKKMTVYLWEGDKGGASSCTGECAKAWPPVTTDGAPTAAGSAVTADLGTITRSDGSKQVTYKGHPLYFFGKDGDAGDAYGEGSKQFGADWYVLTQSGTKVDES